MVRDNKMFKCVQDVHSQAYFDHVVEEAARRGMQVNDQKAGLLCFSAAISFEAEAALDVRQGGRITSSKSLKVLGFTFDADIGCSSHIDQVAAKLRSRTWALIKLKRYGFSCEELVGIYTTYMRPIAEYVSVAWHSMLSAEQSAYLEKQQTQALRHIYGHGPSAAKMRRSAGIDLLHTRRENSCRIFAKKAVCNPKFSRWFQLRRPSPYEKRSNREKYIEPTARTDRYRKSPLNHLRRILNSE